MQPTIRQLLFGPLLEIPPKERPRFAHLFVAFALLLTSAHDANPLWWSLLVTLNFGIAAYRLRHCTAKPDTTRKEEEQP